MTATETREQLLTGETLPAHLTTNPDSRVAPGLEVDGERGLLYCTECDLRITRNSKNHNEYGHARDCSHHQTASVIES